MRLLKPEWVSHDGKPIFSIDIHPDGSRFATGGQGDNSGKVVIWNMAPVKDEKYENDPKVPKMLCQMDNHLACVNCVRWSSDGKYLASAGDDKLVMIWQSVKYGGTSTVFGSAGKVVNLEQWRAVNTLRGHSGDILDVAWSTHDRWLASCSIDNTVVVWNGLKFPEQVAVLKGHTGLVKGVTWDPVGTYLASQSDDKSVRVWRTRDWQEEACITEPFQECGGTTHVLRLDWSPNGQFVVSAHAMNNSGPTAQIIERDGWTTGIDFVGHRKAVTSVRFNPCIFVKKKNVEKAKPYCCCAMGSRDRSLSIWMTALKRPLVVVHDLFINSILDASWSQCATQLLCCSWDGSVAYLQFDKEELGYPFTKDEMQKQLESLYGRSTLQQGKVNHGVMESADILNVQQMQQEEDEKRRKRHEMQQEAMRKQMAATQPSPKGLTTPKSKKKSTKQIETVTKDGKRRITPILLAAPDFESEVPTPFCHQAQPTFSTSTEQSKILVEKKDGTSALISPSKVSSSDVIIDMNGGAKGPTKTCFSQSDLISPTAQNDADKEDIKSISITVSPEMRTPVAKSVFTDQPIKAGLKRHMEPTPTGVTHKKKGRPRKDKTIMAPPTPAPAVVPPPAVTRTVSQVVYSTSGLNLQVPSIQQNSSRQISGVVGSSAALVVEIENPVAGSKAPCKIQCLRGGQVRWNTLLSAAATSFTGNSHVVCVACVDASVNMLSAVSGRRLHPALVLDSKTSVLRCSGLHLLVITSKGALFVWNVQSMVAIVKNESLVSIIKDNSVGIESTLLTNQGLPVVSLTSGRSFTYKIDLGCWVLLSDQHDKLREWSDHQSCLPPGEAAPINGPLHTLQGARARGGPAASRLHRTSSGTQQVATIAHLESQVAGSLALRSAQEYRFWLLSYTRYLSQEGCEEKMREVCSELLPPVISSRAAWTDSILGLSKRSLLQEILPIMATNLGLQRLFTEITEQINSS